MENLSLFDITPGGEKFKPKKSTDWKWKFSDYPKEKNGLKVFSCFACGGGSTMGYKLAGCEVIGCVEIDPKMNEVYVKNHHPKYNYLMDIRDFNALPDDQLPRELFDLDILDGSPPCSTFSIAGQREEAWGKTKKFREGQKEQTLDDLPFIFVDTVKKLRPRCVIMENVEGLLLGNAWAYVQEIHRRLKECGYKSHHWLLKGENMGIPQTRHRVFFIAVREDVGIDPINLDMAFHYEPVTFGTVKEGRGGEVSPGSMSYRALSLAIPEDKDLADVYRRLGERVRCFTTRIIWEDDIPPTLTARTDQYRGEEKTRISVEDIVHIQTFPEDFDFIRNTYYRALYVCAMSVPPVMIKRLVGRLIDSGVFERKEAANA